MFSRQASCLIVLILMGQSVLQAGEPQTVIEFDSELDKLDVPRKLFGIFRDDKQAPEIQFIQEDFTKADAKGKELGFLQLTYFLGNQDAYNGWWLKTRDPDNEQKLADWSAYRQGFLVMRLGATSTQSFKVELKTQAGALKKTYPAFVNLSPRHIAQFRKMGYADVVLPLKGVAPQDPMTQIDEFVIVLEARRVTAKRGKILLHSVRLVNDLKEIE